MPPKKEENATKGSGDPYLLLNISRTASAKEIRKAYFSLARHCHPDRNPAPDAAEAFQTLLKAYTILSDPEKRKLFDRTGCTDQDSEAFWEAYQQYRTIYPEVTKEDVEAFAKTYRHSEEEKKDLIEFYKKYNGNLSMLMAHIMCSVTEDAPRFIAFYESEINKGTLQRTELFDQTRNTCGNMDWDDEEDNDGEYCVGVESQEEEEEEEEDEEEVDDEDEMKDFIVDDEEEELDEHAVMLLEKDGDDQEEQQEKAKTFNKRKSRSKENQKKKEATKKRKKYGNSNSSSSSSSSSSGDGDGMAALRAMMLQRGKERNDNLINRLTSKYGKSSQRK
jgi:curved DNA-binding protein CbpA